MRGLTRMSPRRRTLARVVRPIASALGLAALAGCLDLNRTPDACSVTVAPPVFSIPLNGTQQLVGTAFDCGGNTIRNKRIAFSSANTSVATVTNEGLVIAVGVGSTTVSAVADGKAASAQVTVTPEAVASVEVSPSTVTLRRTQTRQFAAVARNARGEAISGRAFSWSSSNFAIASVDQNGLVSAAGVGQATITATAGDRTGSATVQITEIPIGACTLAPASQTLTVTQQAQPTLTLRDTANNVIPSQGRTLSWSSSNEVVATVSQTGVITAVSAGTARIRAAVPDNQAVSCFTDVTVVPRRVASVVISPRTGSLRVGIPRAFTAALVDSVGAPITGRTVVWSTNTPTVITVTQTGIVTGQALGTARIIATAEGVADTVPLQVTRIPVGAVRISPLQASVVQGGSTQFTATVEDSVGTVVTDRPVEWQSGNLAIATVTQAGLVQGVAPGATVIQASSEGRGAQASIIVQPIPADSIVTDSVFTLPQNAANRAFAIRVQDAAGNQLLGRAVLVTSSQPSIANGVANAAGTLVAVTGLQQGEAILTLQVFNAANQPEGRPSRVRVTVTAPLPPGSGGP